MASRTISFGIGIPQTFDDFSSAAGFLGRFLPRAEALGYEGAWVQEQIVGDAPLLEPVTLITYAAALTPQLHLGTSVLITVIRNPIQLAKSLVSLDQLSNGRLIVGVGVGGQHVPEAVFGVPSERRGQRFAAAPYARSVRADRHLRDHEEPQALAMHAGEPPRKDREEGYTAIRVAVSGWHECERL